MILNPAILALLGGSLLVTGVTVYSSIIGLDIIRNWDLSSGSDRQLMRERKTYLISTALSYVMGFQLISFFLFIYTADHIHDLFVGAMCAAGSLNVNEYGYLTFFLKTITVALCGIWLVVNHTDNQGYDYPVIRKKYLFLLAIAGLLVLESLTQFGYFFLMRPDVITSCCGVLFSEEAETVAGQFAQFPQYWTMVVFYLSAAITCRIGIHFVVTGSGWRLFSIFSGWMALLGFVSLITFISVYFYELPTHHCPFCILQKEYNYIGYPLYLTLLIAAVTGVSVGVIGRFRHFESLSEVTPRLQKKLCITSMASLVLFTALATYPALFSSFKLFS